MDRILVKIPCNCGDLPIMVDADGKVWMIRMLGDETISDDLLVDALAVVLGTMSFQTDPRDLPALAQAFVQILSEADWRQYINEEGPLVPSVLYDYVAGKYPEAFKEIPPPEFFS